MKPLVYVAGPYSSNPVRNTREAICEGLRLWAGGDVAVIIPHLTMLADLVAHASYEDWRRFDLDQLAHCDAVYRLPGESAGADAEVEFARAHGMPVFRCERELLTWVLEREVA